MIGCRISQIDHLRSEAYKIITSYDTEGVKDEQHAVSALLNNWDDAVSLARELHRWVRAWIA
ncbi:hypothetical protein [Vulcanisaeta sp. JCM 16159]|uniref:hypothetical protein n=1 Tax=Vulcanisaeta sp. JCM 16159 TaxID=1295371 RepID=UPI000A99233E|nr:hypothetical protein [Vulcanisaeta sp. JCM 16159]